MKKTNLKISGMHCASCSLLIEKWLQNQKWIKNISVSLVSNSANIFYNDSLTDINEISKKINDLWYKVVQQVDNKWYKIFFKKFIISLLLSLPISVIMFVNTKELFWLNILYIDLIMLILATIIVFVVWLDFHIGFIKKLLKWQTNMDTLISIWTLVAWGYSVYSFIQTYLFGNIMPFYHFLEWAVFIITFITLGKYLEIKSKWNASQAIQKLLQLQIKKAVILKDWIEMWVSVDDLKLWDVVLVKAGDKIPVDWKIIKGQANIDEAMLTGESIYVNKEEDDEVFSGTIVQNGVLNIEVTKEQSETMLAKIIQFVDDAQNSKPPIQHLVDKISSIFVPVILLLAVISFIARYLYTGEVQKSLLTMVSVIVIACPCAMWLATPMAIMVASGTGASKWILIKSGESLEKSKNINVVMFDKTGTLTEGRPTVTELINFNHPMEDIMFMVYSLTKNSNHPLSTAINNYMVEKEVQSVELSRFQEVGGKWLFAIWQSKNILFWNKKLLADYDISVSSEINIQVEKLQNHGKTVNYFVYDGGLVWLIALLDQPKKETMHWISVLKEMWIHTVMISGDTHNTVQAVAKDIGIWEFYAEVHPEEKAELVKKYQDEWKVVAFVWDGINDAPALAQSDLWIAIWQGTDVAIETAEIVLVQWNPYKVVEAINLSRKASKLIKQNLFWAFAYNSILIPVAGFGLLMPMFASLAMSLSSVSVVLNSLRLKKL